MASDGPISNTRGWPVESLRDITLKIGSGATPRGGSETYLAGRQHFALIRSQNVFDRRFDESGLAYITDEQASGLQGVELRPGDVLLNITGDGVTFGRACLVPPAVLPACVNQHVAIIRADPHKADPGYVLSFLTHPSVKPYIASFNSGGSRRAVTKGHIESFQLPLPPLDVQRRISAVLDTADRKIDSNRRAIRTAEALLDALAEAASASLPPVSLSKLVIPAKTTVNPTRLGEVTVDHFSLPAFDSETLPERVPASAIMSNKLLVSRQSILVSRLNPRFNRTWWASPAAGTPALASTEFLVLTASDDTELAAAWLAVRDQYFMAELARRVTGTSGSHQRVRPEDVLAIDVPDTSRASTKLKAASLGLLRRVERLRAESACLASLRDALLPELLSGRIRVNEAKEAVA